MASTAFTRLHVCAALRTANARAPGGDPPIPSAGTNVTAGSAVLSSVGYDQHCSRTRMPFREARWLAVSADAERLSHAKISRHPTCSPRFGGHLRPLVRRRGNPRAEPTTGAAPPLTCGSAPQALVGGAEGVGFEPTVGRTHNGFRDRPIRPLSHPSGVEASGCVARRRTPRGGPPPPRPVRRRSPPPRG
jgi:hypothetical protein